MKDNRLTRPMLRSLRKAASRERGNVCPMTAIKGRGKAEMLVLHALRRRGLIDGMDENGHGAPIINDAGRAIILEYVENV